MTTFRGFNSLLLDPKQKWHNGGAQWRKALCIMVDINRKRGKRERERQSHRKRDRGKDRDRDT